MELTKERRSGLRFKKKTTDLHVFMEARKLIRGFLRCLIQATASPLFLSGLERTLFLGL